MTTILVTPSTQELQIIGQGFEHWLDARTTQWLTVSTILEDIKGLSRPIAVCCIGGSHTRYYSDSGEEIDIATPKLSNLEILARLVLLCLTGDTRSVLISFAFPLKNGVLVQGAKDHPLTDLVGKDVAVELQTWLETKLMRNLIVRIHNDLAIQSCIVGELTQDTITAVVGTGFNLSVIKEGKIQVIEPAGYEVLHPVTNQLVSIETLIGGNDLYKLYNLLVDKPAYIDSTQVLSDIASTNVTARQVIVYSANLLTILIVTLADKYTIEMDKLVIEGSTFWEVPGYVRTVSERLQVLTNNPNIAILRAQDQLSALRTIVST
jgi:predicted NBD/HSP70 family sugar kinase